MDRSEWGVVLLRHFNWNDLAEIAVSGLNREFRPRRIAVEGLFLSPKYP